MIFDKIVDEPGMLDRGRSTTESVHLVATTVSRGQIAAVSQASRRELLESVPVEYIGTAGFVLDYSLLDVDRLGPREPISAIADRRPKHLEDALIAATAAADTITLVTEDRRLWNRIAEQLPQVTLWSWEQLRAEVLRASN